MNNENKAWLALIAWSVLIFVIGVAIGDESAKQSKEREMIELTIELTELEIKKLKKEIN